jgi:signal peptide peptidase SppA
MKLLDIVTAPWAIQPEKLIEIRGIYETHLRGEKIDLEAVEARLGAPLANEQKPYDVLGNVAVVPLVGVLAKRANLFMRISGGTSTQIVGDWLAQAAADPSVAAIVLEIDSPGGQVDGVQQLAQQVRQIRVDGKPVAAWINGVGASGAYWIASAAERIVMADQTTLVGSIGVVATHVDVSKREQALGVKTTEITAGKYKRIASPYAALTEEGRDVLQEQVDAIYSVFVEQVAANRDVPVGQVLSDMADGRVFIGQAAIDAGLVDGVSTLAALVEDLQPRPGAGRRSNHVIGATAMNREQLKTDHPDTFEAVLKEGHDAGLQQGIKQGAEAERARIAAIDAEAMPGHEALTAQAKADGWQVEKYLAECARADRSALVKAAAAHKADAPAPVPNAPPPPDGKTIKRDDFQKLSVADQRKQLAAGFSIVD